jgi:hypothetical protein
MFQKRQICYSVLIFLMLFISACSTFKDATPQEKALITANELSNFYLDVRNVYIATLPIISDSKKEFAKEKIAPKLNIVQDMLILYNQSVIMWNKSGQYPGDLEQLGNDIRSLILDIAMLIGSLKGE